MSFATGKSCDLRRSPQNAAGLDSSGGGRNILQMQQYWPPPEERERERRRLDAIRPWHRVAFVVAGVFLVIALYLQFASLG